MTCVTENMTRKWLRVLNSRVHNTMNSNPSCLSSGAVSRWVRQVLRLSVNEEIAQQRRKGANTRQQDGEQNTATQQERNGVFQYVSVC